MSKRLASDVKEGLIVEIGVFGGVSILNIIDLCIANGTKIVGVDPWDLTVPGDEVSQKLSMLRFHKENLKNAHDNLRSICNKLVYEDHITLLKEFSHRAVNSFEDESIDLLYIDGDHSYDAVLMDLDLWYPKVKKGKVIWGDDFSNKKYGVKKAVNIFCKTKDLTYTVEANSFILKVK
jgi:predicted O-methyltransferase YrrM